MIETLLWIYIIVCLSLIFFQCVFIAITTLRSYIDHLIVQRKIRIIIRQLERIATKKPIEDKHQAFLKSKLISTSSLYRYEAALRKVLEKIENGTLSLRDPDEITNVTIHIRHRAIKDEEKSRGRSKIKMRLRPKKALILPLPKDVADRYFREYIRQTAPNIVSLTSTYRKRDDIIHLFYVYMLKKYGYLQHCQTSELIANLRDLLDTGDTVCAEGVMLAVYQIGDPELVITALKQVDKKNRFLHPKIISDGLLSFTGNANTLQNLFLDQLSDFSVDMQVNLLNYLRFASGAHCERVLQLLQNNAISDAVHFSCIRYLGKYPYEPAFELLAHFASGASGRRIEYEIVALTTLRRYPCQKTIDILCAQINNPSWFIRYNATESLESLGIEYQDLVDIFDGTDRFARDMLQYQFDQRYILDEEV